MMHKLDSYLFTSHRTKKKKNGMKEIWGELWIIKGTMFTQ